MTDDAGRRNRLVTPVDRSPWAIVAGYAGLLSFMIVPAPAALFLGIIAIADIRRHPERTGMGRAIFAVIAGTAGTIILILSLLRA